MVSYVIGPLSGRPLLLSSLDPCLTTLRLVLTEPEDLPFSNPHSPIPCWGHRHGKPCLTLSVDAGDLNSGSSQLPIHLLQKSCTDLTGLPRPYLRSYHFHLKVLRRLPTGWRTESSCHFPHPQLSSSSSRLTLGKPLPAAEASFQFLRRRKLLTWHSPSSGMHCPLFVWHKLHIPLYLDFHVPPQKGRHSARCLERTPQLSSESQCCSYAQQWIQFIIITWLFPCCLHEERSYTATPASQCLKLYV